MQGLSIRATVLIGFVLVLALWLFAWFQLSLEIGAAQTRASGINASYVRAQETLSNVRGRALMASVAFRDALLDPNPDHTAAYRRQLEQASADIDAFLRDYQPIGDAPEQRVEFARLKNELQAYRSDMLDVLATDRTHWLAEARNLLSARVTPRRDVIIAISESVQALNRTAYLQRQTELANVSRTVQRTVWELLGLALAIGLAVAIIAVGYAGRLEQRNRRQQIKDAELAQELQDLSAKVITAQEDERRHIARELHDEIGQALTAIKVELAYAQRSIDEHGESAGLLHDVRTITDGALQQVRDLSYLLHPAVLDEFGLVAAIESYLKTFGKRHGLLAVLFHDGMDARLPPATEAAAYRIVQEALTNVAKHAAAKSCRVYLTLFDTILKIKIEDDGTGFNPEKLRAQDRKGLGLIGIRERAAHLKGTVTIESLAGHGTRLMIELPAHVRLMRQDVESVDGRATA
jgi:signal transduction histidine kinase